MVDTNLYIYAYDEEGDLVFIKKPNKHIVIGGKEEKSIVTTTDIPENAQHFFETHDARAMIEYIQNGDVVFEDETVDTDKLKLAYKDQYGNFYDRLTDKVIYVNDDGDEIGESMEMEFSEAKQILNESGYQLIDNSLYDELVSRFDLDISDISSYFKMYDVDTVINKLNKGKITIDSLYDGMAQWLGIANIFESTDLNEGWSTGATPWQTPDDVREALKYDEISSDYEFIKNFGNFFCYKRKKDGRPIVTYYLISKMGREYGYKDIGLDSSTKYNPSVAKWLKEALIEYGSTEENPGDFKHYWDYINSGTQVKQEKKEKEDIKSKLKPGSKVQMQGADGGITVVYVRPYNNQAFAGHVDGETKLYKWYYRNIKELISESWNTTNIDESTSFTTYLKESGYTLMEYQEQVYQTCLAKGNYTNIDLYFADDIEQGYNENKPVNEVADDICAKFDEMVNNVDTIEVDEPEEEEYTQEQLQAFADYPQDRFEEDEDYDENASEFNEATEQDDGISDGESYNEWKTDVFKYIDKRLDVNKIKELGSYIKDFIKQE